VGFIEKETVSWRIIGARKDERTRPQAAGKKMVPFSPSFATSDEFNFWGFPIERHPLVGDRGVAFTGPARLAVSV